MKITVTKIDVARSQLVEAINLFFEERDPVSIHTLVGASLEILHNHFTDVGEVWDNNLILHYNTIYITDEGRKIWKNKNNEARNFFKHANKDLRKSLEFDTDINDFHIFEAIRCLKIIEGQDFVFSIEFKIFFVWLCLKYPKLVKPGNDSFNMPGIEQFSVKHLKEWRELIRIANLNTRA